MLHQGISFLTPRSPPCQAYAAEKVGVQVALRDRAGVHPCVVEYTEITKEQAEAVVQDAEGNEQLLFSAGNICNHLFRRQFIEDLLVDPKFDYHVAEKKIPYWSSEKGESPGSSAWARTCVLRDVPSRLHRGAFRIIRLLQVV